MKGHNLNPQLIVFPPSRHILNEIVFVRCPMPLTPQDAFSAFIESDFFNVSALGEFPNAITHERLDNYSDEAAQRAIVPALAMILEMPLPTLSRTYAIPLMRLRGWGHLWAWWGRLCALWFD